MKFQGLRGGKTTNSMNNAELPPQIATFSQQFLTMSVAKKSVRQPPRTAWQTGSKGNQGLFFTTCDYPARWQIPNVNLRYKSLKNNEIQPFEVAMYGTNFVATFLHTRSFNILRRSGRVVKRNSSENQRFSEEFIGLIDLL